MQLTIDFELLEWDTVIISSTFSCIKIVLLKYINKSRGNLSKGEIRMDYIMSHSFPTAPLQQAGSPASSGSLIPSAARPIKLRSPNTIAHRKLTMPSCFVYMNLQRSMELQ